MTKRAPGTPEIACAVPGADRLGEGARWSAREQALYWVDVPRPSRLHRWDPLSGEHRTWPAPEMILSLAPEAGGTLLVASDRHLNRFDPATETWTRLLEPEPTLPRNRINDAGVDPAGRFWFGTLQNNFATDNSDLPIDRSTGSLYSYDGAGLLKRHDTGIGASNTVAWSPAGNVLYFGDTLAGLIHAYDFDVESGTVSNRRVFADVREHGVPDGSAVDADGGLWNCRLMAGRLIRFDPRGRIDRVVELPTRMVTSCAFGGRNLDTLYVTTARFYLSERELEAQTLAGSLLAVRMAGVRGSPIPAFGSAAPA